MYTNFVEKHYSPIQFATAMFKFANHCYESKEYSMALDNYNTCLNLRKKNSLNQGYVDVLINSAICLRQIGKIKHAI